jgi:hypothetical protein
MSDSLNGTVTVIVPVSTISANGLLELPEPEPLEPEDPDPEEPVPEPELEPPPRLPAVALPALPPPPLPVEPEDPDALLLEALEFEPAETLSPGERLASETIVPLVGAYSLVSASAVWAFCTLAWAE